MEGIGKDFIEKTKYHHLSPSDQMRGLSPPPVELPYDLREELIDLPEPDRAEIGTITVREAVARRVSVRKYSREPLNLDELSYLLWCTQGVKEVIQDYVTLRTVPSAGARHAFETYLLVNNVSGLQPGIYRYLATKHKLLSVNMEATMADRVTEACWGQEFVKTSSTTFIWTAVVYRMKWRYGERGYRYLYLDAGHVCQNLYLAAESIGCGVCAIGAFSDDEMNRLLDIDGGEQFVIYIATVGKK